MARLARLERANRQGKVEAPDVIVDETASWLVVTPDLSHADWADPATKVWVHIYRHVGKGERATIPDSEFRDGDALDRGGEWVRCGGGMFEGPIDVSLGPPRHAIPLVNAKGERLYPVGTAFRAVLHTGSRSVSAGMDVQDVQRSRR